ncbi:DUF4336 domain-containing protein [Marinobacterium arenosum]|uniref:DUF4336 domain-containing protein n=1 Tax=Marinobacterium arenosum TaxID=2862496 RepID=UPI001C97BD57|nr:DUF4336 domain-containing protein [Marinobacterium arenosum]MBY4678978.1 DUF4336 domain-containing protein [Marinobacterium arenosum]
MNRVGENIWTFDGGTVPFFSLPYSTRMTVVRLASGALWVHSPIKLDDALKVQVDALGEVKYLIAPNSLHHLFVDAWQQSYPDAQTFGTAGVQKKRQDLKFDGLLTSADDYPWNDEIGQLLFTGSPAMEECVFFHRPTRTLIVTDLVENFAPQAFKQWQRVIAKAVGVLAPNGKMPLDWRLSFMFGKTAARAHLETILAWQPARIIMAHGLIVEEDAVGFLRRSFSWLDLAKESA